MQIEIFLFSFLFYGVLSISFKKSPPDPNKAASMARYIVRNAEWASFGTISSQKRIKGYPFVSLLSLSDGPKDNSTGVPYFYIIELDFPYADLKVDNRVSIMVSLAQSEYCKSKSFDEEDPRCARVLMAGKLILIDKSSNEYSFALNAMYDRHPQMRHWPKDHIFQLGKVDPEQIELFDGFGGAKLIKISDYFNATLGYLHH